MPTAFDEASRGRPDFVIGWLRCSEKPARRASQAAVFLTTCDGKPLGLSFASVRCSRQRDLDARRECVWAALRPSPVPPTLVIGLVDELPAEIFAGRIPVETPICRIDYERNPSDSDLSEVDRAAIREYWCGGSTSARPAAHQSLDRVMRREKPLEPLQRVARALGDAVFERTLQGWVGGPGVAVVVDFDSATGCPAPPSNGSGTETPLSDRLRAILAAPPLPSTQPWEQSLEWPGHLMPFQLDGVRALLDNERLLLADDMGLGKTVQAVTALRVLRAGGDVGTALLVVPASLLNQWRSEIYKWARELRVVTVNGNAKERSWQWTAEADVKLVSYETLRSDIARSGGPQSQGRWDLVIADEAQRIKNRNQTSEALKRLPKSRSWALTGTPLENCEDELASIIEFIDSDGSVARRRYEPGAELRARHGELQLRRRKVDVLDDLPPKRTSNLQIELTPRQRATYDRLEREGIMTLRSLGTEVRIHHVLELITRLKQVCNMDPSTGESSKLDDIVNRLVQLTAEGHKALVFSQYARAPFGVDAVARRLRDFSPLAITGFTPLSERDEIISRFKADPDHLVLVLSLRVGGIGLNLQEASYVFHLDRWWNPATESQAEGRTHRFGQSQKVNIYKYSCIGTIEERISEVLKRKQRLFEELVDDVSIDLNARLSQDELFGLFGIAPGNLR